MIIFSKIVNAYPQNKDGRENLKEIHMDLVSVKLLLKVLNMNRMEVGNVFVIDYVIIYFKVFFLF